MASMGNHTVARTFPASGVFNVYIVSETLLSDVEIYHAEFGHDYWQATCYCLLHVGPAAPSEVDLCVICSTSVG